MSFVTKLDYSDNRQIKQFQLTNTKLSGTTEFGLDVNDLGGVNESTVYQTGTLVNITSTFSGNSSTTIFWFGDSSMIPAASSLYAITNLTSGDTQTARGFEGVGPTIVDGNNIYSGYTGSTYDLIVTAITETGVNEWTGETYSSNVAILSGASADFTGRAIWVDVLGVTRTKRLILADKPDSLTGVTTVLTRDEFGDIYEVEFSAVTNDNYISGATFSASTGDLLLINTSGETITTNLDGRYLPLSATTGDDYVTGSTYDSSTGLITFERLSGGTFTANIGITSGDTTNWDSAYNNIITGVTVTGTSNKTLTLTQRNGVTITTSFVDLTGGGAGETITGITFNTTNGDLILTTNSGSTIPTNLDGRYSLTGHTHDFSGLTNTGHTHVISEITDFPTNVSFFTNDVGYLTAYTNTDNYLTTHTFNTSTGLFESTLQSGGTVSVNLDGRYAFSSGHTHTVSDITDFPTDLSAFTNSVGYITGFTDTNDNDYVSSAGFDIGTGVLTLTRLSGGTVTVDLDDRYSLSGHTHDFSELTNTGHTHTVSEITDFPINVSYFTNDVGYLTAYTDTNIFVSGATFNTGNGIIEFTNTSGGTFNVDIDNRYLLSSDYNPTDDYVTSGSFNTTNGVLTLTRLSGGTVTTNLDNRYSLTGHTHDLSGLTNTGHTHTVSEVTDFPTNVSFFTNDVGYLTGYTETGNTDDYVTGGTFNVTNGNLTLTRVSGGTVNVDLDGRYLLITGFTAPTGLEAIDEGNGIGWRLISRNSSNFGDIGLDAVDFSRSTSTSTTRGAVGDFSFAAGENNIVLSDRGTVFGSDNTLDLAASRGFVCGYQNTANNQYTFVANRKNLASGNASSAFGFSTVASGEESFAIGDDSIAAGTTSFCAGDGGTANGAYSSTLGGQLNNSNGDSSACLGVDNDAYSYGEFSIGIASTVYIPTSTIAWAATDRVFNVGNGVAFGVKSDAFTILKNGTITAPSLSNDIILTGDSKIIITKDYLNTYYSPTSGITNNNDYVTSGSFNPANGEVTLTRLSGGTVVYDLDGRYSLTGHTHPEFDNYLFLSGGTLTGPVTGTTFNVSDALLDYQENLDVLSAATEVVATVSKLTYDAVFFDYVVKKDSNLRAGIVMAVHDGTSVTYTDTSTADLGDTSGVVFTVNISGNDLRLVASVTTDNWIIKTLLRGI